MASIHRADGTDPEFNTFPIVTEIAKLRAEKGQLMGYNNYADYSLEKTMAKNSQEREQLPAAAHQGVRS